MELENLIGENKSELEERLVEDNKRKRERKKVPEKRKKESYKVKYIGETGRSGFERGLEHESDFTRLEDRSHMLRHYVLEHQNEIRLDELEFGMRIRTSFRTALERQVGEAIAISREKRAGTTLLNSKAEYNRCTIERLDTRSEKMRKKENVEIEQNENNIKKIIKEMKRTKRERSKENKRRTKEMKSALIEITNENTLKWRKRRKLEEGERAKIDELETENLERWRRKNKSEYEKMKNNKLLREKGLIERKRYDEQERIVRTGLWRNHRNNAKISPIKSDT